MKKEDKGFYAGIITALNLLDLHGQETIYDELVAMCKLEELIKFALSNDEFEWSGLAKREYARQRVVEGKPRRGHVSNLRVRRTPKEDIIDDGFGSSVSIICTRCGGRTMQVVRPGDFRCSVCE